MSTESPTTPPPPAETTTPGAAIKAAWQRFTRGELVSYRVMAILLILIVGVGVLWFMNFQGNVAGSRQWLDLELASTTEDLEKVISDYPGTAPAKVAEFHLARIRLAPEGIDKLVTGDPQERAKALAAIEQAKESLSKMAPELKDSPVLLAECYLGLAKAELALVGITQEGRIDTFRGDPREAAQYLEKLAEVAKDSPWGEEAKKLAAELRAPGGATTQDIQRVQTDLYNMLRFPARPGGGMFGPGGMPFGPGGGMPFGPGSSPFGPISGLPGGGPVAPLPPGHPPLTP
ncbi:tetratricopeptide repeat protein [Urbifossiella limnaea]|uniref:Tetratricopeptide repeat protein n=1 Tax=Urbifossiella limnaea TaxID=2528023 RepID=A0A517XUC6_9BACT|nr:hypothetical protein [Urbifossiella limnaea]QDU21109.1 hypothetical protein ETAA1_30740 [Urbifossiella limnaea]